MSLLIKNVILNGKRVDIFIQENKIKKIGKNLNQRAKEKIEGRGEKAILPGLINCHTHSAMVLFRGYADDLSLEDWLKKKIWPRESKLSEEEVYWGTKLACLEMMKTGTTCFNDMYWHPQAAIEAIKEMGLRALVGLVLIDLDPRGRKENLEKLYFSLKPPQPISLTLAPHAIYTVSSENLIWAKNFAKKNDLILHIHLSETEKEIRDCYQKWKMRPVEYLERIGFLESRVVLAHGIWLSEREMKILAKRKANLIYNPCSNLKLASGLFPYQKLKKKGINISLGTDGPASNNNLDMLEEMKIGALIQKYQEKNPRFCSAQEIFRAATINGAKALRIKAGKIQVGQLADLILIDLNEISLQPGYNLISDLVYSSSGSVVSDLICQGKILMREKKIAGEKEILKKTRLLAKKLVEK